MENWKRAGLAVENGASKMTRADAASLLNVDTKATEEQVKKAFNKLALKHHPDRGGHPEAFRQIILARDILSGTIAPGSKGSKKGPGTKLFTKAQVTAELNRWPEVQDQGWYTYRSQTHPTNFKSLQHVCSKFPYQKQTGVNRGKKPQLIDICTALENRTRIIKGGAESYSGEMAVYYTPSAIHRISAAIRDYLADYGHKVERKEVQNLLQALEILSGLARDKELYDAVWIRAVELVHEQSQVAPPFDKYRHDPSLLARLFNTIPASVIYDDYLAELADASFFPQIVNGRKSLILREPDFGQTPL